MNHPKLSYILVTFAKCCICLLLFEQVYGSATSRDLQQYSYNNDNNNNGNDSPNEFGGDALFMVGNSYTEANNLTGIITNMLEHSSYFPMGVQLPIETAVFSTGGYRWLDLAAEPGNFSDTLHSHNFRWVVLQEQSEIPGFWNSSLENEFIDSKNSVKTLDELIQHYGPNTETFLFQTWGRLHHDDNPNPEIGAMFDSFSSHQYRLAKGYREYQKLIEKPERPVTIAPVGYAFAAIHDAMKTQGLDPEEEGGKFANLYQIDGSHPSEQGSYLAASVLAGILTGQDPRSFDWDYPLVDSETQRELRQVAQQTIADFRQNDSGTPNKTPHFAHEEEADSGNVASLLTFFGKFVHFAFWCGMVGGSGFWAWKWHGKRRNVWRRRIVRNAYSHRGGADRGHYTPLSQGRPGMDMELM